MADSKEQAIIDYLIQCPKIKDTPLFFNLINAKDKTKQFITTANEKNLHRPYIDGSVLKQYTFTIIDFESVTYNAIVKSAGYSNENVDDYLQVQELIDWITQQNKNRNFPDFGEDCQIDVIRALTDNPRLDGIDASVKPALAKYSVSVQIDYLDNSERNH